MASEVNRDIDELRDELSSLRSDMRRIADTLKRLTGDAVADAGEKSRERTREALSGIEREIEGRPLTTIATAFGIGFVLGKLLDR